MAFKAAMHTVNGIRLRVVDEGQGTPVLLWHGFPDSHEVWRHQIPALKAAGYRVIAPDVRGHGESDAPPRVADYHVDVQVADVTALLDVLNIREPVHFIGHDLGAVTGWVLAGRHPQRLQTLTALTVGHPNGYALSWRQRLMGWYALMFQLRGLAEWVMRAGNWFIFRRFARHPEMETWIAGLSRPGRLTAAMNWYRANIGLMLRGSLPSVRVPVLGVWATRDIALTEAQMTASKRWVEAPFRYVRFERASHWLLLDRPEDLNQLLLDWLKNPRE